MLSLIVAEFKKPLSTKMKMHTIYLVSLLTSIFHSVHKHLLNTG